MSHAKSSGPSADEAAAEQGHAALHFAGGPTRQYRHQVPQLPLRAVGYRYEQLDLDFIYKAFTTTDIAAGVGGVRALGIRGKFFSSPVRMTAARARSAGLMPTLGGTYIKNGVKRLIAQRRW